MRQLPSVDQDSGEHGALPDRAPTRACTRHRARRRTEGRTVTDRPPLLAFQRNQALACPPLQHRQQILQLERRDLGPVRLPLLLLVAQEVVRGGGNPGRGASVQRWLSTEGPLVVVVGRPGPPFDGPETARLCGCATDPTGPHTCHALTRCAAIDLRVRIGGMDAGGVALVGAAAGLLGAAIGAGGAIGTAVITSRRQARSGHEQWRRQVRRDAYVTFLAAIQEALTHAAAFHENWVKGGPAADIHATQRMNELNENMMRARSIAAMEGPAFLSKMARELLIGSQTWILRTFTGIQQLATDIEESDRKRALGVAHRDTRLALHLAMEEFEEEARRVLDDRTGFMDTP